MWDGRGSRVGHILLGLHQQFEVRKDVIAVLGAILREVARPLILETSCGCGYDQGCK